MLSIVFDIDLDGSVLEDERASMGRISVGTMGLIDLFEARLGILAQSRQGALERIQLADRLLSTDGFWSESVKVDPLGVAKSIEDWTDELVFEGWSRETSLSPRLDRLLELSTSANSLARRLARVVELAQTSNLGITSLVHLSPRDSYPVLIQRLFQSLEEQAVVAQSALVETVASGNLASARVIQQSRGGPRFVAGDDSFQFFEPDTALSAASQLTSYLSSNPGKTAIIGATPQLDSQLALGGLTTSGRNESRSSTIARFLDGLVNLADQPYSTQLWLSVLTSPVVGLSTTSKALLFDHLRERVHIDDEILGLVSERRSEFIPIWKLCLNKTDFATSILQIFGILRAQKSLFLHRGLLTTLTDVLTKWRHPLTPRFVREVIRLLAPNESTPRHPASSGISHIKTPAAMLSSCERVVWWNFREEQRRAAFAPHYTEKERTAIATAGIGDALSTPRLLAERSRFLRPLFMTTKQLILVAPKNENHPHPLWDAIRTSAINAGNQATLSRVRRTNLLAKESRKDITSEERDDVFNATDTALTLREVESASSLSKLVGCSLAYVLNYKATLIDAVPQETVINAAHEGKLLHDLLEQWLGASEQEDAGLFFGRVAPAMVSELERPQSASLKAQLRKTFVRSSAMLSRFQIERGLKIHSLEERLDATVDGLSVQARCDAIFKDGERLLIMDYKRSGQSRYQKSLRKGTSLQLGLYAAVAREVVKKPADVCYFILRDEALLQAAEDEPSAEEVWRSSCNAVSQRTEELNKGTSQAAGIDGRRGLKNAYSKVVADTLQLSPPCYFCEFKNICGRDFEK